MSEKHEMNRIDKAALQGWGIVLATACLGAVLIGAMYLLGWV